MRLTEKQKAVLLALTNGWQTPAQIASKIGYCHRRDIIDPGSPE